VACANIVLGLSGLQAITSERAYAATLTVHVQPQAAPQVSSKQPSTPAPVMMLVPDAPRIMLGRVWMSDTFSRYDAEDLGVEMEHALRKGGVSSGYVEAYFNEHTLAALKQRGVRVDVLIPDAEAHARTRLLDHAREQRVQALKSSPALSSASNASANANANADANANAAGKTAAVAVPANFKLGSMGGFFTLSELYAEFSTMRRLFPDLISEPVVIGSTHENRPLYVYRLGTTQSMTAGKPELLLTALHHAREPGSAMNLIYFFWTLFERYKAQDPEARYLLNNRQIYVVPVINPDGYAFNEARSSTGGGLWRKNRRDNGGGFFGVDLNRNYGTQEFWDAPNGGSSGAIGSDTYRGTAPFSEPETQAIRSLCNVRNFKTALNYHSYSDLLIYPFSYINSETPDSTYFRAICAEITKVNRYSGGRDLQTVGYAVRGASDDWMYAEGDGHSKIMVMTPEVGRLTDEFWPFPERIPEQGAENLITNFQTVWSAETNLRPVQTFLNEEPQTGRARLVVEVQNIGVTTAASESTLNIAPLATEEGGRRIAAESTTINMPQRTLQRLRSGEVQRETFVLQTDSMVQNGTRIPISIIITQDGVPRRDTVTAQVYLPNRLTLFPSANSASGSSGGLSGISTAATGWNLARWSVVNDRVMGKLALTDSPQGSYRNNDRNYLQYGSKIDLRGLRAATLEFQTRWSVEANYDFAVAEVSTDDGRTWKSLRSNLMKAGRATPAPQGSMQVVGTFGFDGNFPSPIRQECSLDEFLGSEVLLRFGMLSENDGAFDGWYLADIAVRRYAAAPTFVRLPTQEVSDLTVAPSVIFAEREINLLLPASFSAGAGAAAATGRATVNFYNVLGQLVATSDERIADGQITMRNPSLPAGTHLVVVSNGSARARQRIIVGRN
jgi:carboxypeptidase T